MTAVQYLSIWILVVKCPIRRANLACIYVNWVAIGVLLNVSIRIRVFAGEEPLLSSTFSVINHSLVGAWAFTLRKVNDVLIETVGLIRLRLGLISIHLLVHLVVLLTGKGLFKLELLL